MSQPNKSSKAMSSRLLTMKFMQRAAASTSSPPGTPPEPPSKKQRLSNGSYDSVSSTPQSDAQAIDEALATEDQRQTDALAREAAARGETKWYLSFEEPYASATKTSLRIVSAGYGALDGVDSTIDASNPEDDELPQVQGRRNFGKFNRKTEKQQDSPSDSSSDSGSSKGDNEDEDTSDDPTGAKAMISRSRKEAGDKARAERKAKKKAVREEAARLAEDRRRKQVRLNEKARISGGGSGANPSRKMAHTHMTCVRCGEQGHVEKDCHIFSSRYEDVANNLHAVMIFTYLKDWEKLW